LCDPLKDVSWEQSAPSRSAKNDGAFSPELALLLLPAYAPLRARLVKPVFS
jgi:hypothetical protein